ncbi:hypothetical protein [Streptomyces broussonetiae]|uniref:Uncharacterized protein n=1 Tax=Streptomyces broussonetiae TaxID=2686304 RepID=A0A6I6NF94_9ACTN|nr:hypothetical protein [Streptomyces broussonetiae]QHA08800.1 hypothetical protein GQF42_41055 [Streptomyces broussonetiae]
MSDLDTRRARRAVRQAARHLAQDAPSLTAASAGALRAGLAARATRLRRAALAAWLTGVPEHVIAVDARVPVRVVHGWITQRHAPEHADNGSG